MNIKALIEQKRRDGGFTGQDVYLILTAIKETAENNSEVQELIADIEEEGLNIRINISLPDTDRHAGIWIENGKIQWQKGLIANPTLSVSFSEQIARDALMGKSSFQRAYREGQIQITGSLSRGAALVMILNICADDYNVL
jgi:alkyl sulfatase BDS1-like metallo-beta-lactamase superfamily hydrolase